MSMNIYICGKREITFKKKDGSVGTDVQYIDFNAMQTPTSITYKIKNSSDPAKAYKDWILSQDYVEQIPIYHPDDLFEDRDPIGYQEYSWAKEHATQFEQWMLDLEEKGFQITFEVV